MSKNPASDLQVQVLHPNTLIVMFACLRPLVLAAVLLLAGAAPSGAQEATTPPGFKGVGMDEQLGQSIPMDIEFMDAAGNPVALSTYFESGRPVVLNFVYHNCPMLCSVLVESFTKTMTKMDWTVGQEFDVLTVSFSATETPDLAARQKERYLTTLNRPGAEDGWHFLTGSEENIQALAAATGFEFKWVASRGEFAHPAALIFLSPDGVITRYLHGLYFEPKDVRKAIVEASEGTVGTAMDQILLYCFQYDPGANSYVIHATNLMKLAAALTLLLIGLGLWMLRRNERVKTRARLSHTTS